MRRSEMLEVRMSRAEMRRLDRLAGERRETRSSLVRSLIAAASVRSAAVFEGDLSDMLDAVADDRRDMRA